MWGKKGRKGINKRKSPLREHDVEKKDRRKSMKMTMQEVKNHNLS